MRLCADEAAAAMKTTSGARPLSVGEIVANWGEELRETLLARYGLPREALADQYAQVRDQWLAADETNWLAAHSFHSEAVAALRECAAHEQATVYVLTTKPQRCAVHLPHWIREQRPLLVLMLPVCTPLRTPFCAVDSRPRCSNTLASLWSRRMSSAWSMVPNPRCCTCCWRGTPQSRSKPRLSFALCM